MKKHSGERKNTAGGSATAGGINFQAAVSAIASVYMSRGQPLLWLEKLIEDIPVAVYAETGGEGDDIRILLKSGEIVEVQVKKGLKSGGTLWDSLIDLANGVKTNKIHYGVLIVSPTSSNTITDNLARDIIRLGDGRIDNLSEIAVQLVEKFAALDLSVVDICKYIRIHTINAIAGNQADIRAARSELAHLCAEHSQVNHAWNVIYNDSALLIEKRSRRDLSSVLRLLKAEGIKLSEKSCAGPILLLDDLNDWIFKTHAYFSVFGIKKQLRTDVAWIPLQAIVQDNIENKSESLEDALKNYQAWDSRSVDRDAVVVNPETLGRFVTRAILIGGPGMGKTTLLKRIARRYSENSIPVLHVRLTAVISRMRAGDGFEDAIFALGLDGSGISPLEARQASFPNWLLLCDGLDECGKSQEEVALGVVRFATGYPQCRVIVTTRPVGYNTAYFSDWRHYCLAPLEQSSAKSHLAMLVSECLSENSIFQRDIQTLCATELEKEETSKIVTRNPLLLGLAASIIVRGGHLSSTKQKLYEKIFDLIDDAPNSRIPEPPASAAILQHYLNILGWYITENPISSIKNTLDHCARELAHDSDIRLLKARSDVEIYLKYWQDIGMIEKIGHGYEETLAFIHKTFGEFAAARYLCSMSIDKQKSLIMKILFLSDWKEVIGFSALSGMGEIIGHILISPELADFDKFQRIVAATKLIADANPSPCQSDRKRIVDEAFNIIISPRRDQSFSIGIILVAAARRFPEEVGGVARNFLDHKQPWAYLVAWAIVVAAGTKYYHPNKLVDVLQDSVNIVGEGVISSLSGGIILKNNGRKLLEVFVLDAISVLLDSDSLALTDSIILDIINRPALNSIGFLKKLQKLFSQKNKNNIAKEIDEKLTGEHLAYAFLKNQDSYMEACRIEDEAILYAIDRSELTESYDENKGKLLNLSAFHKAAKIGEMPVSDVWAWTLSFDKAAVQEIVKGIVGVSGINSELLQQEVRQARSYIRAAQNNNLYNVITHVDHPVIDWSIASSLNLNVEKIEIAIHHPSVWVTWIASNLIENLLSISELELLIQRILDIGKGYALWVASGLSAEIEQGQAIKMVIERLSKPLVLGCEYLFNFLIDLSIFWSDDVASILQNGLRADVDTALSAAKLADNFSQIGQCDLMGIVAESIEYWKKYEKPYPIKGGVVPPSPRAKLIEVLLKTRKATYVELVGYIDDVRSDVKSIGSDALMILIKDSSTHRIQFLKDVDNGLLSPNLLSKALDAAIPLNEDEVKLWGILLTNKDAKIRFNSMSFLHKDYIDSSSIREYARILINDGEQQIRERAYRILDVI